MKRKNACREGDYAINKSSKIHANEKTWEVDEKCLKNY